MKYVSYHCKELGYEVCKSIQVVDDKLAAVPFYTTESPVTKASYNLTFHA